jgi:hypothetical protein
MDNNTQDLIREAARKACMHQLQDVLIPVIYEGLYLLWNKAKEQEQARQIGSSYVAFQNSLSMIPKWNNIIIRKRHEMCAQKCPWIDRLIEKVFLLHAQLIASVAGHRGKIPVRVPESTHMLHTCYINSSKRFWVLPYLFEDRVGKHITIQEQQQNLQKIFEIIKDTIETTVLELLPMQAILDDATFLEAPEPPQPPKQLPQMFIPPPQQMVAPSPPPPALEQPVLENEKPEKELSLPLLFQKEPSQCGLREFAKLSPEVEDILKNGRVVKNNDIQVLDGSSIPYTRAPQPAFQ